MASLFGHSLLGFTLAKVFKQNKTSAVVLVLAIVSAILPDIDVLGFYFGIPYASPFGHRGFTHSILFALLWSSFVSLFFSSSNRIGVLLILFFATLSHGILDALTTGGHGVGFFIPFDNQRIFFSYRFIKVSPIGVKQFFSSWGMQVLLNELKYIAIPCGLVLLFLFAFKQKNKKV